MKNKVTSKIGPLIVSGIVIIFTGIASASVMFAIEYFFPQPVKFYEDVTEICDEEYIKELVDKDLVKSYEVNMLDQIIVEVSVKNGKKVGELIRPDLEKEIDQLVEENDFVHSIEINEDFNDAHAVIDPDTTRDESSIIVSKLSTILECYSNWTRTNDEGSLKYSTPDNSPFEDVVLGCEHKF